MLGPLGDLPRTIDGDLMTHSGPQNPHDGSVALPKCPTCRTEMAISRIVPAEAGRETRTYRCARCGEELAETVPTHR